MYIHMLKDAPYEVSYAGFAYLVQPIALPETNSSYIAARLITDKGKLWEPPCEHELTLRFPDADKAGEVWSTGFQTRQDYFIARVLVERLVDEEAAAPLEVPAKPLVLVD